MYTNRTWSPEGACTALIAPDGGHVGFHAKDSHSPWHDRAIGSHFKALLVS